MNFIATRTLVRHGRGGGTDTPSSSFLAELVGGIRAMPAEVFSVNASPFDVFNFIHDALGPWEGQPGTPERLLHRRAVMAEIMRVCGAFESTWNWLEGHDTTNPTENNAETDSAGLWQISHNSRGFGQDLRDMLAALGIRDGLDFQHQMKHNHPFAMEYTARLFRWTTHHNGPLRNLTGTNSIYSQLSPAAVQEFKAFLA